MKESSHKRTPGYAGVAVILALGAWRLTAQQAPADAASGSTAATPASGASGPGGPPVSVTTVRAELNPDLIGRVGV